MDFFVEHYVRGFRGAESIDEALVASLRQLADVAAASPRVLCHRDYHARNLMVLRDGELAMVDIQDARWGPDTYDLASLLRDAYVDLDEELVVELCERYRTGLPDPPEPGAFRSRFGIVAAQRMIKALGTFGYQVHRLGRDRYREAIPRTVRRLSRLLPTSSVPSTLVHAMERAHLLET
jgi:aminoglycoside/choline kinase family phosphotransferase